MHDPNQKGQSIHSPWSSKGSFSLPVLEYQAWKVLDLPHEVLLSNVHCLLLPGYGFPGLWTVFLCLDYWDRLRSWCLNCLLISYFAPETARLFFPFQLLCPGQMHRLRGWDASVTLERLSCLWTASCQKHCPQFFSILISNYSYLHFTQ